MLVKAKPLKAKVIVRIGLVNVHLRGRGAAILGLLWLEIRRTPTRWALANSGEGDQEVGC